jgi:hypothetical protein
VNGLFVDAVVETLHMRDFQRAHGLDGLTERFVGATVLRQRLSGSPQDAKDLRSIKPLPLTMLAEAHNVPRLALIRSPDVSMIAGHHGKPASDS